MAIKCTNQFRKKVDCMKYNAQRDYTMEDVKSDFKDINLDHNIWQC